MDSSFREFISGLLRFSNLKKKYINVLINDENIEVYKQVFTHISVDAEKNYEFFEILGDVTLNKSIVWYLKERFPNLQNAQGVKIIARLRINLVSKKNFSSIAAKLGFAAFIRVDEEHRQTKMQSVMEDVFEAFFGATELLIDKIVCPGSGYGICYRMVKSILDQEPISLKYEDLYDPITRLKETFDFYRPNIPGRSCPYIWGNMKFESTKQEDGNQFVKLIQFDQHHKKNTVIGTCVASLLDEAKHAVCSEFLEFLRSHGYKRPIPDYYQSIL